MEDLGERWFGKSRCAAWGLKWRSDTVDGQNPAPPRMMIIPLLIGF